MIGFRIATAIDIGFHLLLALCDVQLIEGSLEVFHLVLLWHFLAVCKLLHPLQHLLLGLVDLALGHFFCRNLFLAGRFLHHRSLDCRFLGYRCFSNGCFGYGFFHCGFLGHGSLGLLVFGCCYCV